MFYDDRFTIDKTHRGGNITNTNLSAYNISIVYIYDYANVTVSNMREVNLSFNKVVTDTVTQVTTYKWDRYDMNYFSLYKTMDPFRPFAHCTYIITYIGKPDTKEQIGVCLEGLYRHIIKMLYTM